VETDAPFLAPQLHRGHRNEPAFVSMVADKIGALKNIPAETVAQQCAENTIRLFGLPISTGKE